MASFPTAYSSFAISLGSRDASGRASMDKAAGLAATDTASSTAVSSLSILKSHGKSRSTGPHELASASSGSTAKVRSSPRLGSKHGVRFSISQDDREGSKWRAYNGKVAHGYPQHHRRSSTAAFLEYIKTHLPESRHRPPVTLTVKRAFLLFCVSQVVATPTPAAIVHADAYVLCCPRSFSRRRTWPCRCCSSSPAM